MKIYKGKYTSFCFGVKKAIEIARQSSQKFEKVYILEDIVHNERVSYLVHKWGIKKVKRLESIPKGTHLLVNAHGLPKQLLIKAEKRGVKIVDATCPKVKKIHKIASQLEKEGYLVLVIGDKHHKETEAIMGNLKGGIIVEDKKDIVKNAKIITSNRVACIAQSTQNLEKVASIVKEIVLLSKEVKFINTICEEIKKRQEEIKNLSKKVEAVIIVGSRKSANTTRLFNIAKKINKNTFFIEDVKINTKRLKKLRKRFNSFAVAGGASTPPEAIKEVIDILK